MGRSQSKKMAAHEDAATDGKHEVKAKGDMGTVKRVTHGKAMIGGEECGGRQGSKGLGGADPN